jgi:hypothetical protein
MSFPAAMRRAYPPPFAPCLPTGPETRDSSDHQPKLLKPRAKLNLSSFNFVFTDVTQYLTSSIYIVTVMKTSEKI